MTTTGQSPPTLAAPIAIDAARIVAEFFPDLSLRTWRRLDSSAKCPSAFKVGGRKLYRISDLKAWAAFGFPDRGLFEARLTAEGSKRV